MTHIEWHGFSVWQIEDEYARIVIVPALGAKIASLVDKQTGQEWLAPPTHPVHERGYGDTFTDHDLSGWDEMFPTINACPAPHAPHIHLPDHGEVWALPWDVLEQDAQSITLRVTGRALAYTLTRRASLERGRLRLDYQLDNLSGAPLPYLWAAHPLFTADAGCTVELPAQVTQVINTADHPQVGAPDILLTWPVARLPDGSHKALNAVGDAGLKDYRKVYVPPEQTIASGCVRQSGRQLCLTWQADRVPYLGIWIDEGTYTRKSTVALEPATGYYDSLTLAHHNGRVTVAPVGEIVRWWVEVSFSDAGT
jgi:galactose mutarotase-like enzyme